MTKRTDARRAIRVDENGRRKCDTDTRIAIIGGGCSGVTAAYKLHEKGYRNISLYEASDRVGGKVHSMEIDGHVVEVGAVGCLTGNRTIFGMAREFVPLKPASFPFAISRTKNGSTTRKHVDRDWRSNSPIEVALGLVRLARILWFSRFRSVFEPGFHNLDPDLVSLTMTEFARKHKIHSIMNPFFASDYACGWGSTDQIPALYLLKMMKSFETVRRCHQISWGRHSGLYTFHGGYQALWEEIAAYLIDHGLELHLGTPVAQVVRRTLKSGQPDIQVVANGQTRTYDRLFVATPPDQTLKFIDGTHDERDLFGRVSYLHYSTVVFHSEGLNENECVLLTHNMRGDRQGGLVAYFNDYRSGDLFVGYQLSDVSRSEEELDDLARRDVRELGGTVREIIARKAWKYFPHVKLQDLDADYYPRLNALQGERGTYYLGGLFAFESTGHCAQFAEFIVNQFREQEGSPVRRPSE
ncbi:MAG: FAD-dependent oxidoreductase [Planctomycetes bacterium]|nr:FAD-dependent oxidoreductase [Planctomycetota bacterium]